MRQRNGFTIIETVVATCVGLIVLGFAVYTTVNFMKNRELEAVSGALMTYLRAAETRSLQSERNISHGVSTVDGKITLFSGNSYALKQTVYDLTRPYGNYFQFSGISEVVFAKQTGTPSVTGTITVTNGIKTVTIVINSVGRISKQ